MRLSLFAKKIETPILILPLIFLAAAVIELAAGVKFSADSQRVSRFVANLFFLNGIHAFITFALLFSLPEFRTWIASTASPETWTLGVPKFWIQLGAVLITILCFFYVLTYVLAPEQTSLAVLIGAWFPLHHGLAQTYGLSTAYSHKIKNESGFTDDEKRQVRRIETLEKRAYTLLLVSFSIDVSIKIYGPQVWNYDTKFLEPILTAATLGSVLFWLYCASRYPRARQSNKIFFLSRLLLLPLAPVSVLAAMGVKAAHGTEYIGVFDNMKKNTTGSRRNHRQLIIWTVTLSLIAAILIIFRRQDGIISNLYNRPFRELPDWIKALNIISLAFTYAHYWIERQVFHFRDPKVRMIIGPLLTGQREATAMVTPKNHESYVPSA